MKKILPSLLFLCFGFLPLITFSQTFISSQNFTASTTTFTGMSSKSKSLKIRFEIQNDSLVLIDSFITNQSIADSFLHTDFQGNPIQIDYSYPNTGFMATSCVFGDLPSWQLTKYSFKLFHKDSFMSKTINYKNDTYELTNDGFGNWTFTPDEEDVSTKIQELNVIFTLNPYPNCAQEIYISNDSIFIQVISPMHPWNGANQLLQENLYSNTDSFNLRIKPLYCANVYPAANPYHCYKVYVGDTATTNSLDIKYVPPHGNDVWYHYEKTAGGIQTQIIAPLPAIGLELHLLETNQSNLLSWSTLSEQNTSHFNLMKSYDAKHFYKIKEKEAAVNSDIKSEYSISLRKEKEVCFYRIDLIDIDQSKLLSNVVSFTPKQTNQYKIFPNPATNSIAVENWNVNINQISIYNMQGQKVIDKIIIKNTQSERLNLSSLSKGLYLLEIKSEDEKHIQKIRIE